MSSQTLTVTSNWKIRLRSNERLSRNSNRSSGEKIYRINYQVHRMFGWSSNINWYYSAHVKVKHWIFALWFPYKVTIWYLLYGKIILIPKVFSVMGDLALTPHVNSLLAKSLTWHHRQGKYYNHLATRVIYSFIDCIEI